MIAVRSEHTLIFVHCLGGILNSFAIVMFCVQLVILFGQPLVFYQNFANFDNCFYEEAFY